jgi:glycosyltransferase involved in cell wall biosynthesis
VIREVVIVIPARNEEALVAECLLSVRVAAPQSRIIVVADSCTDRTVTIAREFAEVIETDVASVGQARAAGVRQAISGSLVPRDQLWIANTDADSVVPPNWIAHQLELARENNAAVVVGTVRPRAEDLSAAEWAAWHLSHSDGQALGHVHGANLGFRADACLAVGGFAALDEHEDNDLVHRLHSASFAISASDGIEVVTSGRRVGRTPGGYARYLRNGEFTPAPDLV